MKIIIIRSLIHRKFYNLRGGTGMKDIFPSITENEWLLMKVVWEKGTCTAADFVEGLEGVKDISARTVRVMINRLVKKGVLEFEVDPRNSTVHHYHAKYTQEECIQEKSQNFKNAYFSGDGSLMLATMVKQEDLSEQDVQELISLLERRKGD